MPRLHQIAKDYEIETELPLIESVKMGFINEIYVVEQTSMFFGCPNMVSNT
jgi:hypothetical protein